MALYTLRTLSTAARFMAATSPALAGFSIRNAPLASMYCRVISCRYVKFPQESRTQRHVDVVRVAQPVKRPFAARVHALVQRIALQLMRNLSPSRSLLSR